MNYYKTTVEAGSLPGKTIMLIFAVLGIEPKAFIMFRMAEL